MTRRGDFLLALERDALNQKILEGLDFSVWAHNLFDKRYAFSGGLLYVCRAAL